MALIFRSSLEDGRHDKVLGVRGKKGTGIWREQSWVVAKAIHDEKSEGLYPIVGADYEVVYKPRGITPEPMLQSRCPSLGCMKRPACDWPVMPACESARPNASERLRTASASHPSAHGKARARSVSFRSLPLSLSSTTTTYHAVPRRPLKPDPVAGPPFFLCAHLCVLSGTLPSDPD